MSLAAKEREVLQLLRFYSDWHGPYGGAGEMNFESKGQYGPAGMILAGMAFDREHWSLLQQSFEALQEALDTLSNGGPLKNAAYLVLLDPYIGDPADASKVDKWRKNPRDCRVQWHDLAIRELAILLRNTDLYVPRTSRMQTRKTTNVAQMNDEFYALYERMIGEGETKRRAIRTAAEWCGYSEQHGYEIVRVRTGGVKRERKKV